MSFTTELNQVVNIYQSVFTAPTWEKIQPLVEGLLLAHGPRTVASALRAVGLADADDFSRYHQVLNCAEWSGLELNGELLTQGVERFCGAEGAVRLVLDETLERRWGQKINARSHFRDPLAWGRHQHVASSGLRWIVLSVVVEPVWSNRAWALPVLSVLAPAPDVTANAGRRHKTVARWAQQMIGWARRQLPGRELTVRGDQHDGVHELAAMCQRYDVQLIAPLVDDAQLHAAAPPPTPGASGRPRQKGERLPTPAQRRDNAKTAWKAIQVRWYAGRLQRLELTSATGLWYRSGQGLVALRYVVVRDPKGRIPTRVYLSTRLNTTPRQIVQTYVLRWTIETLFEESRAHLGIETQRQWSDRAIARTTPLLYGLYSLTALLTETLQQHGQLTLATSAWYQKTKATFADALAAVRRYLWEKAGFNTAAPEGSCIEIPAQLRQRIEYALFYAR